VIKWTKGVPPLNEFKENELILVVGEWGGEIEKPFIAEYAEGMLSDHYDREPFYEGNVIKWARIEDVTEPEPEPEQKYYFIIFLFGASVKTTHHLLTELHPLDWQVKADNSYPGQYKLTNWKEISEEEYKKYGGEWE
jgi:hypothetical protein